MEGKIEISDEEKKKAMMAMSKGQIEQMRIDLASMSDHIDKFNWGINSLSRSISVFCTSFGIEE